MIKILHSADWHLCSPLSSLAEHLRQPLLQALNTLPEQVAQICCRESCDLVLLSGDIFDGPCTTETRITLCRALEGMQVPVFISPGNHDPIDPDSPWVSFPWPENVHIFSSAEITSVAVPGLDCRVWGAAFTGMDCPSLLDDFHPEQTERYAIGLFHGDPTDPDSPYNPITAAQVSDTGLNYLALGHIHKRGQFFSGSTLCAWPGCPVGRGFDEAGQKGLLIATLDQTCQTQFIPLDVPRFYDQEVPVDGDPARALAAFLPPVPGKDIYRLTLTGRCSVFDPELLQKQLPHNLQLRNRTLPPIDTWSALGQDSLEGVLFQLLKEQTLSEDPGVRRQATLAAELTRQLLDGEEVTL